MHFVSRFRTAGVIALATLSLPTLALAQTVTVTDIAFESENGLKVSIPTLEAVGANLDAAAIRNLFHDGLAAAAKTLATLDAERVSIPTMTVASPALGPAGEATGATYRGLELTGIADGIASGVTIASAEVTGAEGAGIVVGKTSMSLLDLGAIVGFYGYGDATDEMKPIYGDFVVDDMRFDGPGFSCAIGTMHSKTFSSRPLKGTDAELVKWTGEFDAAEREGRDPAPEAIKAAVLYFVDILTAFRSDPITVAGLDCDGKDETGAAVTVTAGPLTIGGFEPGIYPAFGLEQLRVEIAGEGMMEFGGFTWKPMDFSGPIAVTAHADEALTPAWFEANWRQLIPALDGLSLSGAALDLPGEGAGERIKARIDAFDLTLADYLNGIPATLSSSASGVSFTLPPDAQPALAALGLDDLVLGYNFAAKWDAPTKTIAVADFTFTGNGLGGVSLSGTIGNAGDALFATDPDTAAAAAMALTIKQLTLSIDNQGFVPALLAFAALEQGQTPQTFQVVAAGMAAALPLALLGATPDAKGLSAALGNFLQGAPHLNITLTANDPAGIGIAELMAAQNDPSLLRGKVAIAAAADGEKVPFTFPDLSALTAPPAPAPEPATPEITAPPAVPAEAPTRADDKSGRKQQ